jgi:hypothetical protein
MGEFETQFNQFKGVNQNLKKFSKSRRFFDENKPIGKFSIIKSEDELSLSSSSCDDIISYENLSNGLPPNDIDQNTLLAKTKLSKMKKIKINRRSRSCSSSIVQNKSCDCNRCLNLKNFEMEHSLGQKRNLKFLNNFLQKLNCLNVNSY